MFKIVEDDHPINEILREIIFSGPDWWQNTKAVIVPLIIAEAIGVGIVAIFVHLIKKASAGY